MTKWEKIKREAEGKEFSDLEIMGFVSRGQLIVLQTHGDNFEVMTREEKLNTLAWIEKSVQALREQVKGE